MGQTVSSLVSARLDGVACRMMLKGWRHFQEDGFGPRDDAEKVCNASLAVLRGETPLSTPIELEWEEDEWEPCGKYSVQRHASFLSPMLTEGGRDAIDAAHRVLPPVTHEAHVRVVVPRACVDPEATAANIGIGIKLDTPTTVFLASSGDQGFERRTEHVGDPLAEQHGVATIVLENCFYGRRCPWEGHDPSHLHSVSNLALKGTASAIEGYALLDLLHRHGMTRLCSAGLSMGGEISSIVGASMPFPVACAPLLPVASPSGVWCDSVMADNCDYLGIAAREDSSEEAVKAEVRAILDRIHINTFPVPVRPDACVIVAARHDGYIPAASTQELHDAWCTEDAQPELRWINGGHVSSFVFNQADFRKAIIDALSRLDADPGAR